MKTSTLIAAAFLAAFAVDAYADPVLKPIAQIRVRHEVFDTLKNTSPGLDKSYDFGAIRARGGLSVQHEAWEIRAIAQAVLGYSVPDDASFGAGRTLFVLSGRDSSPSAVDLTELTIGMKKDSFGFAAGRLGFKDLPETPTGNDRLDWLRKARLSERLVGTWEWTPLGRRFDGLTASAKGSMGDINLYGGRVLQGGFDVDDGFQPLDDVFVAGFSAGTAKQGRLKNTDLRFFTVVYRDDRSVARTAAGDDIDVDTYGLSLASVFPLRDSALDFVAWTAIQRGDYGRFDQRGSATALEVGYGAPNVAWAPWLRVGINQSSGDDNATDNRHETFFNVLPTNHKFYGIQDLSAFQNLSDTFVQLRAKPHAQWTADATVHVLRRTEKKDAWYGGSGAASDETLGFDARIPAAGASEAIGTEYDFVAAWQIVKQFGLEAGVSRFEGGSTARSVFPSQSDATFAYLQASYQL